MLTLSVVLVLRTKRTRIKRHITKKPLTEKQNHKPVEVEFVVDVVPLTIVGVETVVVDVVPLTDVGVDTGVIVVVVVDVNDVIIAVIVVIFVVADVVVAVVVSMVADDLSTIPALRLSL